MIKLHVLTSVIEIACLVSDLICYVNSLEQNAFVKIEEIDQINTITHVFAAVFPVLSIYQYLYNIIFTKEMSIFDYGAKITKSH